MAEVGEASVKLKFDTTGASKGLQEFDSEAKKAAKSAGDGFTILKGVAANLVTQGINVAADGITRLGRSFVNIGKTALNSYADYEQLIGGVDTLFKDASDAVQSNAKAAFRTAGLSANEYMETVTSFSASLLQGLGGDTARAAEISDMAVKDMADNVNKMGTDMSLVQYAYQGFAKDNYTMLDNLKLGYGGSATEMARLINDSGVLNGQMEVTANNVRDVPFDKMIEAIHKVQENMGITGTTALEASETISGSVSMARAAWSNLVTGIANDNANWQQLVDDFIQSILTAAKNILPRVKIILQGMVNLVSSFVHDIMPSLLADVAPMVLELLPAAIDAVQTIFSTLATLIPKYLPQIVDGLMLIADLIIDNLPTIIDVGLKIVVALAQGITNALPRLLDKLPVLVEQIANVFIDNLYLFIDVAIQLMVALAEGITIAFPKIIEKVPMIVEKLAQAFIDNAPLVASAAVQIMAQLGVAILTQAVQLISAVDTIISDVVSQIGAFISGVVDSVVASIQTFCQSVADFVLGILFGIRDNASVVIDAIVGFITSVPGRVGSFINAIKDAFVNAFNAARDFISNAVGAIVNFVASIPGRVSARINAIKDAFVNAFNNARNWARDRVSDIVNFVSSIPGKIGGKINEIGDKFRDAFENIKKIVSDAIEAIIGFIASIPSRIGDIGGQIGGQISSGVSGAIEGVKGAISGLLSNIPGLATGGYVHATPGGTLAVIGEGGEDEFVIPRSQMIDILTGVANRPLPELKAENMRVDGGGVAIYNTFQINNELDAEDIGRRINNSIRLATS